MEITDDKILDQVTGGSIHYITVKVEKGDNLVKLANQYGTTWRKISAANHNIKDAYLEVGMELRIPVQD